MANLSDNDYNDDTEWNPLQCKYCRRKPYSNISNLNRHICSSHNYELALQHSKRDKKFEYILCDTCQLYVRQHLYDSHLTDNLYHIHLKSASDPKRVILMFCFFIANI
jgi:hypothetical protein